MAISLRNDPIGQEIHKELVISFLRHGNVVYDYIAPSGNCEGKSHFGTSHNPVPKNDPLTFEKLNYRGKHNPSK